MSRYKSNKYAKRTVFAARNNGRTQHLFSQRLRYKQAIRTDNARLGVQNIVDFSFGEKSYYGRMNYEELPIVLRDESVLTSIRSSHASLKTPQVFGFVERLFNEMANVFRKKVQMGSISGNDPYLSELKAYRAFESPALVYRQYQERYLTKLGTALKSANPPILDIGNLVHVMIAEMQPTLNIAPLTYGTFIKSKFNSIMTTGLAIEIANLPYEDDQQKINSFTQSPNWQAFVEVCNLHGFMIDATCPWRIVADLNSKEMRKQMLADGYANTKILFEMAYNLAISDDLTMLLEGIHTLYNISTKGLRHTIVEECPDGGIIKTTKLPKKYTRKEVYRSITVESFIIIFCKIRLMEQRPHMSAIERGRLIRIVLELYSATGTLSLPLIYLEEIVSKTFDKVGSISYYRAAAKRRAQEKYSAGLLDNVTVDVGVGSDISSY